MKKLVVLMIAAAFCVVGSGVALADEPAPLEWDRHAVWTKWSEEDGNRSPDKPGTMETPSGAKENVTIHTTSNMDRTDFVSGFDFIRETKEYDYSREKGNSA